MKRLFTLVAIITLAVAVWNLSATAQFSADDDTDQRQRRRDKAEAFSVTASEDHFVMVESRTGRTWILHQPGEPGHGPVWLPIERIDEPEKARQWQHEQIAATREHEHRQRAAQAERAFQQQEETRELIQLELQQMQERVERELKDARERHGAEHPRVRELQAEIDRIVRRRVEESRRPDRGHEAPSQEPARDAIRQRLHETRAQRERLTDLGRELEVRLVDEVIKLLEKALEDLGGHDKAHDDKDDDKDDDDGQ